MIKFTIDEKILLEFYGDEEVFHRCVSMAKLLRLKFLVKEKKWACPAGSFDKVLDAFRDIDVVEIEPEDYEGRLTELLSPKKELEYKEERIVPDYSLLNFLPFEGKHPNEKFQHIDIRNSLQRNRYGLFLDMGLGKSYIFAAIFAHYFLKWKKVSKVLILSSNTGVRNLPEEFSKFIKDFDEMRYTVANKDNRKPFTDDVDIVFSSYNTFRLISKAYQKTNSSKPRKAFIPFKEWFGNSEGLILLDESHQAANPNSQQGNFVAIHAPAFKYRYLGTGTPADKPEKLYNQLKIMDNSLVHGFSFSEWKEYYAELGNRFSAMAITGWQKDKMAILNKAMQEYSVFRKAEDTIELPENKMIPVYCTLSKRHKEIYETFVATTMEENRYKSGGYDVRKIVNLFPYLSLSLHNPKLLEKHFEKFSGKLISNIEKFKYSKDADSIEALKGVIEDRGDEKGIIWVVHPSTAEELSKIFEKLNPIVITGKVKDDERRGLVDAFRTQKKHKILIANIDVLNTSYTIVEASWQFYLERHYNYTTYSQSKKRIHRIGQEKNVRTYYSIYRNTIDILLDANLQNKGTLVEGLTSKKFLTESEWKRIFNPDSVRY